MKAYLRIATYAGLAALAGCKSHVPTIEPPPPGTTVYDLPASPSVTPPVQSTVPTVVPRPVTPTASATNPQPLAPLPPPGVRIGVAPAPTLDYATSSVLPPPAKARKPSLAGPDADITLDFADTDLREIVKTVLGKFLQVPYTIDPAIQGSVTLSMPNAVSRDQALAILRTLLAQNGAVIVEENGLYQVQAQAGLANRGAVGTPNTPDSNTEIVPLRYANARDLSKVVQPFAVHGIRVIEEPGRNALLVQGDALSRSAIVELIHAFDVNILAGQSYAVFPVTSGTPEKVATELQKAMLADGDKALAGQIRIIPMARINAILVASSQPRYVDEARRLVSLVDRATNSSKPSWHVYIVQNGQSSDLEYLLQRAFTPNHVTATGASDTNRLSTTAPGFGSSKQSSAGSGGGDQSGGFLASPTEQPGANQSPDQAAQAGGGGNAAAAGNSPALGSLSAGEPASAGGDGSDQQPEQRIRIIADRHANSLLIYASPDDYAAIEDMLQKIDLVPLQVRIDVTIAEVTLTDNLQYGTQFFFKHGGLAGELNGATSSVTTNTISPSNLTTNFPGFVLNAGGSAVDMAIQALRDVTTVRVLSSPQVSVLDNEQATIEVGDEVPLTTGTAISTVSASAPIVNSVSYRQTGVVLQIIPRVNNNGLVAIDLQQLISQPITNQTSTIDSPTFQNRLVKSRVVIQDGQTIGVAGLIRDSDSKGNAGIPGLKDVPVLGSLFSSQNNARTRTELLVLMTPHVIADQRTARLLTEDLRATLPAASTIPDTTLSPSLSLSSNPNGVLRP